MFSLRCNTVVTFNVIQGCVALVLSESYVT